LHELLLFTTTTFQRPLFRHEPHARILTFMKRSKSYEAITRLKK
jgi:hypothetical protein